MQCLPVAQEAPEISNETGKPVGNVNSWSAEEYLRIVRDEAQSCPSTLVAAAESNSTTAAISSSTSPSDISCPAWSFALSEQQRFSINDYHTETVENSAIPYDCEELDYYGVEAEKENSLHSKWIDDYWTSFKYSREEMKRRKFSSPEMIRCKLPQLKAENQWFKLLYPTPPLDNSENTADNSSNAASTPLDILMQLKQPQILALLEYHAQEWLSRKSFTAEQYQVIYGLMSVVDELVTADEVSVVRGLARKLISMQKRFAQRSIESESDLEGQQSMKNQSIWCQILTNIIARLFGQLDLIHSVNNREVW